MEPHLFTFFTFFPVAFRFSPRGCRHVACPRGPSARVHVRVYFCMSRDAARRPLSARRLAPARSRDAAASASRPTDRARRVLRQCPASAPALPRFDIGVRALHASEQLSICAKPPRKRGGELERQRRGRKTPNVKEGTSVDHVKEASCVRGEDGAEQRCQSPWRHGPGLAWYQRTSQQQQQRRL